MRSSRILLVLLDVVKRFRYLAILLLQEQYLLLQGKDGLVLVAFLLEELLIYGLLCSQLLLQFLDRGGGVLCRHLVLRILATDFSRLALRSLPCSLIIVIFLDFFDAGFATAGQKILRLRRFFVRFFMPLFLERLLNELLIGTFDVCEEACKLSATILVNELLEGLVNVGGGGLPRGGRRPILEEL